MENTLILAIVTIVTVVMLMQQRVSFFSQAAVCKPICPDTDSQRALEQHGSCLIMRHIYPLHIKTSNTNTSIIELRQDIRLKLAILKYFSQSYVPRRMQQLNHDKQANHHLRETRTQKKLMHKILEF